MATEHASEDADQDTKPQPERPSASQRPRLHAGADIAAPAGEGAAEIVKAGDVYRDSTEFAAERMKALLSAYSVVAGGLQEIQKTYAEALRRSMEMAASGPRELMQCKSLEDVAVLQREMLCRGLDEWFDSSAKLLGVSSRIAEDAMRPGEEKAHREAA